MADRRRINAPSSGTFSPTFISPTAKAQNAGRTRRPNQLRKIYLETGVVPAAKGSAYLELENPGGPSQSSNATSPSLKLSCAIHGPKPLPRNAGFSSNLQLTLHVKFTPFATRKRRGYIRDATERDIGTHLETALNGVIIPDRWPKSAIDIVITIIEAEDDIDWDSGMQERLPVGGIAIMNVVSGCITVASAALLNARIDCLDLVTGGVAALATDHEGKTVKVLDPSSSENPSLTSVCVVGYMPTRDEITLIWAKGDISTEQGEQMGGFDGLLDSAVNAANGAHFVLRQVATELAQAQVSQFTNDKSKT